MGRAKLQEPEQDAGFMTAFTDSCWFPSPPQCPSCTTIIQTMDGRQLLLLEPYLCAERAEARAVEHDPYAFPTRALELFIREIGGKTETKRRTVSDRVALLDTVQVTLPVLPWSDYFIG